MESGDIRSWIPDLYGTGCRPDAGCITNSVGDRELTSGLEGRELSVSPP